MFVNKLYRKDKFELIADEPCVVLPTAPTETYIAPKGTVRETSSLGKGKIGLSGPRKAYYLEKVGLSSLAYLGDPPVFGGIRQ